MNVKKNFSVPPGWVGGYEESKQKFAYPNPNLTSIPFMCNDNQANLRLMRRQQNVRWPEFSWITGVTNSDPNATESPTGENPTRCFSMFSPYISRVGYTDTGRIYSLICPQQGVWLGDEICLNIEVTVTNVRGWINEKDSDSKSELAADMQILPKIWLSPKQGGYLQAAWPLIQLHLPDLPLSKEKAININSSEVGNPHHPYFHIRRGEYKGFKSPDFARHEEEAYMVSNLEVQILDIVKTNDSKTDAFNELLMDAFNLGAGNMLSPNTVLTWNVWTLAPTLINLGEWKAHASKWRHSIDAHHGPPYKEKKDKYGHLASSPIKYYDGSIFVSAPKKLEGYIEKIYLWLEKLI